MLEPSLQGLPQGHGADGHGHGQAFARIERQWVGIGHQGGIAQLQGLQDLPGRDRIRVRDDAQLTRRPGRSRARRRPDQTPRRTQARQQAKPMAADGVGLHGAMSFA